MTHALRARFCLLALMRAASSHARIGRQFPSERKVVKDPVTGTMLTFLTSQAHKDIKLEQAMGGGDMALDGSDEWVYFRVGKSEAQGRQLALLAHSFPADFARTSYILTYPNTGRGACRWWPRAKCLARLPSWRHGSTPDGIAPVPAVKPFGRPDALAAYRTRWRALLA